MRLTFLTQETWMLDHDLLAYLIAAAAGFSGYPSIPVHEAPSVVQLSQSELNRTVCPDDLDTCRSIVAVFETDSYVIYLRDDLDLDNPSDNSFLVHELVHVLQHRAQGDDIFADCERTLQTETEAYRAQNRYLKREGQFLRVGAALAFMACSGRQNTFFTRDILSDPQTIGIGGDEAPALNYPVEPGQPVPFRFEE
jgi:hypothetical protein